MGPVAYFAGAALMRAPAETKNRVLRLMQEKGVYFFGLYEKDGCAYFYVLQRSAKNKDLLALAEVVSVYGLRRDLKRSLRRPGIYIGVVIFILGLVFSDMVIWDVRYVPGGGEDLDRIAAAVAESGIKSGALKSAADRASAENLILLNCPDVSYADVSISGGVVTVTTDERRLFVKRSDTGNADLRASDDGYVLRYETYAGRTVCEKGQTVKKGDVLISGTYDTFHHGAVTVKARGRVYALVCRRFELECPDTEYEKTYTGKSLKRTSFVLFSSCIGPEGDCDPDEYEKDVYENDITVFETVTLPIKIRRNVFRQYRLEKRRISRGEAEKKLLDMYEERYRIVTDGAEVKSAEKKLYYENGRYVLRCETWLVCNIAV
ncbi:MAG: sporulation protein YqfD [Clostridia bacterium]|nr:sporulation protein YqfD [Clostridia bacterium]